MGLFVPDLRLKIQDAPCDLDSFIYECLLCFIQFDTILCLELATIDLLSQNYLNSPDCKSFCLFLLFDQ